MERLLAIIIVFVMVAVDCGTGVIINDCHFIDNSTISVMLICESFKGSYPKDNCWHNIIVSKIVWQVKMLKYSDCGHTMTNIKFHGSYSMFSELRILDISYARFQDIDMATESVLNTLQVFNASDNQLIQIPNEIFNFLPNLIRVDFSHNQILNIYSNNFIGEVHLSHIYLSNNMILNLEPDSFSMCQNMKHLDLSNNLIETIDDFFFLNNSELNVLNLENNPMKKFDISILSPSNRWFTLQLSWHAITEVDISCKVPNCLLSRMNYGNLPENLDFCTFFNASGNHIRNITEILDKLSERLEILDLSWNFIGTLETDMMEKFYNLRHLNLSHSILDNIEINAFRHQNNLMSLDLSYNNLIEVDGTMFPGKYPYLEILNIEGNTLTTINHMLNFPYLKSLAISKNRFSCADLGIFLSQKVESIGIIGNPTTHQHNINGVDCYNQDRNDIKANKAKMNTELTDRSSEQRTSIEVGMKANIKTFNITSFNKNSTHDSENSKDADEFSQLWLYATIGILTAIILTVLIGFGVVKLLSKNQVQSVDPIYEEIGFKDNTAPYDKLKFDVLPNSNIHCHYESVNRK